MIDLTNINEVKSVQHNIHATFDSPQGKEVMRFLEQASGWYESIFDPDNRDRILINAGRREVVATLKTFLEQPPEQIVAMAEQKEQNNG
uniref:Bbp19-like phage domain-containing protein n=1 Tax=viral metagenome TaxID=1070528 RepID=A0A6M3L3Q2_9ZZZZ